MPRRWLAASLIALLVPFASGCGAGGLGQIACLPSHDALLVLSDIAAGTGDSELKRTRPDPTRTTVQYDTDGRHGSADVYVSGTPRACVVLTPGASTAGKDDERLVAFAGSFARTGFAVVVPDLENVKQLKLSPDDGRAIADAFRYAHGRADLAPAGRIGLGAFSYALGPTILGALEPDVKPDVRFILGVGGYHDLTKVITYFTTGAFRPQAGAPWRFNTPNTYGKWAFVYSNVDRFTAAGATDKAALTEMANRRIEHPDADISDLVPKLQSPEGKALYALLTNANPDAVPGLITALPEAVRGDLAKLDLANKDLSGLSCRLILFHGYEDDLVPYPESIDLAAAVPHGKLFLVHGLQHVDYKQPGFFDAWSFGCGIQDVLDEQWKGPTDG